LSIEKIIQASLPLKEYISKPIEFQEPAMKLDLESRSNSETRQFNHLHQMCLMHAENYIVSNQIKLVTLIDAYIALYKVENSLGLYNISRSILELAAFLNDITSRTKKIKEKSPNTWKSKGQEFFVLLIRARFGTSDKLTLEHLIKSGISKKNLKPINVMGSIESLMKEKSATPLKDKYGMLCDYVHHNLSSQFASSSGFRIGDIAHAINGGGVVTEDNMPINSYEYPNPAKAKKALKDTENIVLTSLEICIEKLNFMPNSPFDEEQLKKRTGSSIGLHSIPKKK